MRYLAPMHCALKIVVLLLLVSLRTSVQAIPATELKETYQPIVDRNPFGLKPPPPPQTNNPTAPVKEKPKTEMFLTGITSIGYPRVPKKAYIMTKETAGKKEPTYYSLSEGVERDGIKVLSIDDAGKKVRVHTEEGEVVLSFQTHGVPPPVAPAAAKPGQPGVPGQPGAFPVPPPPGVTGQPQPVTHSGQPTAAFPNPAVNTTVTPGASSSVRQIPSRRVRAGLDAGSPAGGGAFPAAGGGAAAQPEIDPAEQYIRMHLNKAAAEKQGMAMPPLPIIGQ